MAMTTRVAGDHVVALFDDVLFHVDGPRPPGSPMWPGTEEHALIGSAAGRWTLLPLTRRRVAAAGVDVGGAGLVDLAGRAVTRLGLRTGVAMRMLPDRYAVRTSHVPGMPGATLHEHLGDIVGCPGLAVAARFDPGRPHPEPIRLQLLTERGRTVGYALVGWDPATVGVVEQAAEALAEPAAGHLSPWRSGRMLVVATTPPARLHR